MGFPYRRLSCSWSWWLVVERQHHSAAPDLPGQRGPSAWAASTPLPPLRMEKASISFEDLGTVPSSFTGNGTLQYHGETGPSHLSAHAADSTAGTEFGTRSQKTPGKIFWPWSYEGKRSLINFPVDWIRQEINLRILILLFTFNEPSHVKKQQLHSLGKQEPSWIRGLFTKSRWAIRS